MPTPPPPEVAVTWLVVELWFNPVRITSLHCGSRLCYMGPNRGFCPNAQFCSLNIHVELGLWLVRRGIRIGESSFPNFLYKYRRGSYYSLAFSYFHYYILNIPLNQKTKQPKYLLFLQVESLELSQREVTRCGSHTTELYSSNWDVELAAHIPTPSTPAGFQAESQVLQGSKCGEYWWPTCIWERNPLQVKPQFLKRGTLSSHHQRKRQVWAHSAATNTPCAYQSCTQLVSSLCSQGYTPFGDECYDPHPYY